MGSLFWGGWGKYDANGRNKTVIHDISISDELPSFLVEDVISKHLTDIGRISIIVVFCTEFFKPVADLLIVFYVFGGIAHIGYSSDKSITQIINI